MDALHTERNIRAKIQNFENQNTNEIPKARPRNATRPTLAPKPSVTRRASVSSTTKEEQEETNTPMFPVGIYEQVISTENFPAPPAVIPRPQIPRKLSLDSNNLSKLQPLLKPPPQTTSRPSLRRSTPLTSQDEDTAFRSPPPPPLSTRPPFNSHCSTRENEYVENPASKSPVLPVLETTRKKEREIKRAAV